MLQLSIEAGSAVDTKSGVSKKTGMPYAIPEQVAFLTLPNGERRRITLQHESANDAPLPPGNYEPRPAAVYVDKFGGISISTRAKHWVQSAAVAAVRKVG